MSSLRELVENVFSIVNNVILYQIYLFCWFAKKYVKWGAGRFFWAVSVSEGQKKSSWVSEVCDFNSQNHTDQINHDKTTPLPIFFLPPQRSPYLGDRPRSVSVEIREISEGIRVLSTNVRWKNPPTKSTATKQSQKKLHSNSSPPAPRDLSGAKRGWIGLRFAFLDLRKFAVSLAIPTEQTNPPSSQKKRLNPHLPF